MWVIQTPAKCYQITNVLLYFISTKFTRLTETYLKDNISYLMFKRRRHNRNDFHNWWKQDYMLQCQSPLDQREGSFFILFSLDAEAALICSNFYSKYLHIFRLHWYILFKNAGALGCGRSSSMWKKMETLLCKRTIFAV